MLREVEEQPSFGAAISLAQARRAEISFKRTRHSVVGNDKTLCRAWQIFLCSTGHLRAGP